MKKHSISRRRFLKTAASASAAVIGFPYIVSSSALGKAGAVSASNRITMGGIGIGWQGEWNMKAFLNEPDLQVLAVCDIDKNHLNLAKQAVDGKYHNNDCATYHDFREIIARDDIDTMLICLPDHWHAISAVTAARAGKDIFGEKPISHKLAQGRAICNAVERYSRIWQTGSWQRSVGHFRFGCELVRNGRLGKVKKVDVLLPSGHTDFGKTSHQKTPIQVPEELDYDFWLGPAPYKPYAPARVHKNWRWVMDYGGGQLTDWIGHHADIGLWGLGMSHMSPIEVEATGRWVDDILWDTPVGFNVTAKYANGVVMNIWDSRDGGMGSGT
ncbi:MAG: Gfo/Idh/MocA family oxidoreductase, partial [Planctomycetota bacterium]